MGRVAEVLCEQNQCLQEPELIDEINSNRFTSGWRARNYSEFWGRTLKEGVELRLGTLNPSQSVRSVNFFNFFTSAISTQIFWWLIVPSIASRFTKCIPCDGYTNRSPCHESSMPGLVGLVRFRTWTIKVGAAHPGRFLLHVSLQTDLLWWAREPIASSSARSIYSRATTEDKKGAVVAT